MEQKREIKYYFCNICGKLITVLNDAGTPTVCCGEVMKELKPNTVDADTEKHVPVVTNSRSTVMVSVGSKEHPMTQEHYIQWILVQTKRGIHKKQLFPGDKPMAVFSLSEYEEVVAVYIYCNLHKLWKVEL